MSQEDTQRAQHAAQQEGTRQEPAEQAEETQEEPTREQLLLTLQNAQSKADQYWNQLLSARAEVENSRRRSERDVENAHKYALERFVRELLPVKDSLELGLGAAVTESPELAKLREGMELTLKMLGTALEKFGVTEINPQGERFNPDLHQAMAMQDIPGAEPNTVLTVYQKGYLLNERLIRPAMVVVSGGGSGQRTSSLDERA